MVATNYRLMVKRPSNGSGAWELLASFATQEAAKAESERLAANSPGTEYFVMLSLFMTSVVAPKPTTVML